MNRITVAAAVVEAVTGNIVDQPDIDAVVNAANAQLRPGGGVAGAIHRTAGPGLEHECRPLAPLAPGKAVITGAHALPNRHVIHCLGPVYGRDEPADRLLADCYRNALQLAREARLESVAFPALSTGAFGFPMDAAAAIAVGTVVDELRRQAASLRTVRFVLADEAALAAHAASLQAAAEN